MAKNVRRAMMPECEIYKIELAEGDMFMIQLIHLFDVSTLLCNYFSLFGILIPCFPSNSHINCSAGRQSVA